MVNEKRIPNQQRRRRPRGRPLLVIVGVIGIVVLATLGVQSWLLVSEDWAQDVVVSPTGQRLTLQFRYEPSEEPGHQVLMARVRDQGGWLMPVESIQFSVRADGQTIVEPLEAEGVGVFSSTGEGRYVATVLLEAAGEYEVVLDIRHQQSRFTKSWPMDIAD